MPRTPYYEEIQYVKAGEALAISGRAVTLADVALWSVERHRSGRAKHADLPPEATWDEIFCAEVSSNKRQEAMSRGFASDIAWQELYTTVEERHRTSAAKHRGLAPDATWSEIQDPVNIDNGQRVKKARALGLEPTSSWDEVYKLSHERDRTITAGVLGLADDASWEDVFVALAATPANPWTRQRTLDTIAEKARLQLVLPVVSIQLIAAKEWSNPDAVRGIKQHLAGIRGLEANATWDEIFSAETVRKASAPLYDLPETASWDDIMRQAAVRGAEEQQAKQRQEALACGLAETATREQISDAYLRQSLDAQAKQHNLELGLTYEQMVQAIYTRARHDEAVEHGFPEDATLDAIRRAAALKIERRSIIRAFAIYNLPEDATWEQLHEIESRERIARALGG